MEGWYQYSHIRIIRGSLKWVCSFYLWEYTIDLCSLLLVLEDQVDQFILSLKVLYYDFYKFKVVF